MRALPLTTTWNYLFIKPGWTITLTIFTRTYYFIGWHGRYCMTTTAIPTGLIPKHYCSTIIDWFWTVLLLLVGFKLLSAHATFPITYRRARWWTYLCDYYSIDLILFIMPMMTWLLEPSWAATGEWQTSVWRTTDIGDGIVVMMKRLMDPLLFPPLLNHSHLIQTRWWPGDSHAPVENWYCTLFI